MYDEIMLKPQDLGVILKYILNQDQYPTLEHVAQSLGMTASNVHLSVQRSIQAKLLEQPSTRIIKPIRSHILEFLTHGAKYVFYAKHGGMARGTPTAHAAAPLNNIINQDNTPPVWADANGNVYGISLAPLWKNASYAAQQDPKLYELLALVDALRIGKIRERKLAAEYLEKRLKGDWS
jgi:hypothetical protein